MAKKVNYTDEMVTVMTTMYQAAETDAERKSALTEIAEKIGRSVPSVRTKLSQLKVYVKPGAGEKTESKADSVSKAEMIEVIEPRLGLEPGEGKSLKMTTKVVLQAILDTTEPDEVALQNIADAMEKLDES